MATRKPLQIPGAAQADDSADSALQDTQADAPKSELPRASDIDPTKLSRAVLTQDGWVCPA